MRTSVLLGLFVTIACTATATIFGCSTDETSGATPGDGGASDATSDTGPRSDGGAGDDDAAPGCNAGAAPDPLSFEALVIEPPSPSAELAGATVELVKRSDRSVITSATSDDAGTVKLSVPTGGVALDALLRVTASPGDAGPRMPFINEFQYGIQLDQTAKGVGSPTVSLVTGAAMDVGVTLDPAKTIVQVLVESCSHLGLAGATVAVDNRNGPFAFDTSATATGAIGLATAFNVSPGATKITLSYQGETITHETKTVGGEIHWILMNP